MIAVRARTAALLLALTTPLCMGRAQAATTVSTLGVALPRHVIPVGLAFDRQHDLYVSDYEGRILRLDKAGSGARVIAGPPLEVSSPGFRDGPLAAARFDRPMGLAADARGTIYVADSGNACIRKISGGMVTTFAGRCGSAGTATGAREAARFSRPLSLALDSAGSKLYVADFGGGPRSIDLATGNVDRILPEVRSDTRSVSLGIGPGGKSLFIVDSSGILRYEIGSGKSTLFPVSSDPTNYPVVEGGTSIGHPMAIVGLGQWDAVFSDFRANALHYLGFTVTRTIAGPSSDDPMSTAGFADGVGGNVRFAGPIALAIDSTGEIAIADSGNHRIRLAREIERDPYTPQPYNFTRDVAASKNAVAFVGTSYVWWNTDWQNSIEGRLQEALDRLRPQQPVRVIPLTFSGARISALAQYASEVLAPSRFKTIVIQVAQSTVQEEFPDDDLAHTERWKSDVASQLVTLKRAASEYHKRLVVALEPEARDVAPLESFENHLQFGDRQSIYVPLRDIVAKSGIPFVDPLGAMRGAAERGGGLVFGSFDPHLTPLGRGIVADEIARYLARSL